MSDKEFSKLRLEIDDLPILQKLDVVHFEKVNAELQNNVEKDGKILYKKFKKVKLIDVCTFQGGSQPPKNEWIEKEEDGFVRMLQIRDFTQGHEKYIQYVKDNSRLKKCQSNDILIGRYGASIGKILTGLTGAYNVALMKVTPNKLLNREYLYHYLKSNIFQNIILSIGSRAAQAGFNKEDLSAIEINLPILEKQKQIAKTLDKANELIELRKESITKLGALAKSIFIDMFGDPVSNPKGWEIEKLENLVEKEKNSLKTGPFGSSLKKEFYVDSGYKIYGQEQVIADDFEYGDYYIDEKRFLNLKNYAIKTNDVLISLVGSFGKIAIVPKVFKEGIINPRLMKISFNSKVYNPIFFKYLFYSESFNQQIKNLSHGGTMGILNLTILKNLIYINPSIDLQNKFAEIIEKIEEQKSLYEKELELLQNNFDALLQKSFQE
jgi:type I restriction enzyme S subunit